MLVLKDVPISVPICDGVLLGLTVCDAVCVGVMRPDPDFEGVLEGVLEGV